MKIRQGFVSNSSSSSFVFVTTVANHENVMAALEGRAKEIMDKFPFGKGNCLGQDVMLFGDLIDNGGEGNLDYQLEEIRESLVINEDELEAGWDEEDYAREAVHEAIQSYKNKAKEKPAEVFEWSAY